MSDFREATFVGAAPLPKPRRSLRRRFLFAIVALVGLVLGALATVFVLTSRSAIQRDVEQRAEGYAALAAGPVCDAYETYYLSGYSKFRELTADLMRKNTDLVGLAIYDTTGRRLFDSEELARPLFQPGVGTPPRTDDPRLLAAVKGLRSESWRQAREGDDLYRVVVPYVEEWGRHRYSAVFDVSYRSVRQAVRELWGRLLWLSAASLLLGAGIAFLLARQILRPLSALTAGAHDFAEGRLGRQLEIRTGDELEVLAGTFNHMSTHLALSIADLEAGNRALQHSNVELRELDRMKSDLLANVSHELRTPLTSVKGYAEALSEELLGPLTDAQREALEVSSRNLDRLLHMINELLSYARFESGKIQVERRPTDLVGIARQVVEGVVAARGPALDLRLEVDDDLPAVDADGTRIAQVIENLVTNAVKFTPVGGSIVVRLHREGDEVGVEVADSGIGIPREEQNRIFDRFYQVESSSTRKYGGIGLGLAIVRQILDAHGCAIEVVSEPGQGATFRFRLPVADHLVSGDGRGPRVVVVDDDVPFARALAESLEEQGYVVRVAGSFHGAERLVRELRPRLVLLDRLLPDGDGFDLIVRWRQHLDAKQLPIVVISVRDEALLARRLGANASLVKPVEARSVLGAIEEVLAGIRAPTILLLPLDGGGEVFERVAERLAAAGLRLRRLASEKDLEEAVAGRQGVAAVVSVGPDVPRHAAAEVRRVLAAAGMPTALAGSGEEVEVWRRETQVVAVAADEADADAVASALREAVSCIGTTS
jgi:signal transduction histidine kinase/DNA-binding response OmpR family regulator